MRIELQVRPRAVLTFAMRAPANPVLVDNAPSIRNDRLLCISIALKMRDANATACFHKHSVNTGRRLDQSGTMATAFFEKTF